jgi:rod shape-determining protein MreC
MLKYIKEYRFYIILFVFILIPVLALDTSTRAPKDYRLYDRAIVSITFPIQAIISATLDGVSSAFQNYLFLWNTRKDNLTLLEENRKLLASIVHLREAELENQRLRTLLSLNEQFSLSSVTARVISKDVSTEFRAIRINRGTSSGVEKDMAVINSEGVVGRVMRVDSESADVVTLLDLLSAVDALVQRSRVRGIVEGKTEEVCQLKFALRTDDIQVGDLLVTSGLGGIFPRGIPVGSVSSVVKKEYGITQTVEVRPAVDFSRVEEVLVIKGAQGKPIHTAVQSRIASPPAEK